MFMPALRCIGNILTCSNPEVIERCMFCNVISELNCLLMQTSTAVIKETLWSFSNITAGPTSHVRQFVESNAFDRILVLAESRNLDLKKEATYVLANSVTGSDLRLRGDIYDKTQGSILGIMLSALFINDARLLRHSLEAIGDLFSLDEWFGIVGTD